MNDTQTRTQSAGAPAPSSDRALRSATPDTGDDRRRVRDRQRQLVRASLIARPPGASSTHRRWAESAG